MPPPETAAFARIGADLGLTVDGDACRRLSRYVELLQQWSRVFNLTAVRDPAQMLGQHIADCMAVVPPLMRHVGASPARLLDVGSGAGLPGVVIAVLCPALRVTCLDAVAKKIAFVRQVAAETALPNLAAVHGRAETFGDPQDVIVSRAFATLGDFCRATRHGLAPGGVWMAMKGRVPQHEIAALPGDIDVFHVEQLQVPGLAAARCLVWMRPAGPATMRHR